MITREQAIILVRESLSENVDILEDEIIELEYGWMIFSQSSEFIRTRDRRHALVGSGGDLVEKETGRIYRFGSAYSTEDHLRM